MHRELISLGTAAAMAVAVSLVMLAGSAVAEDASGQRHVIEIRSLEFSPKELDVAPGDTVVWVNKDFVPHTMTADDASWDSDFVDKDGQWEMLVGDDTHDHYFCQYHPSMTAQLRIVRR